MVVSYEQNHGAKWSWRLELGNHCHTLQKRMISHCGDLKNPELLKKLLEQKTVSINDASRTPFGIHAFCALNYSSDQPRVLDACAGPHTGTENKTEYVKKSIDYKTNLYLKSPYWENYVKPGTDGTMTPKLGVTEVVHK